MYNAEKQLVKAWLKEFGLPEFKLRGKMVADPFGGSDMLFVTVQDWVPHRRANDLEVRARVHGFFVQFAGGCFVTGTDNAETKALKKEIRREYMARLEAQQ